MSWGATPEDWAAFDLLLGLTEDLLPVVSNPGAVISPQSRLKGLGKTPSRYDGARQVSGIAKWTQQRSTARQVEAWSKEPDYGICIQTRSIRALDIDVPDVRLAGAIALAFERALDCAEELPLRVRGGSGKRLLALRLEGDLPKRSFKVDGGLVEFLATGQQFVACGTHPSGTRYEWVGGLPDDFPAVSLEQFERAWAAIVAEFAIEAPRESQSRGALGEDIEVEDPVAEWLVTGWETYGAQGGKLFVACPWKNGHSGDSGETEAAWLLAGTRGFAQGHFECLHASCAGRADDEFLDAVGYRAAAFEVLPDPVALYQAELFKAGGDARLVKGEAPRLPLPGFERDKSGKIEPTIGNVVTAAAHSEACGFDLRFDTFRAELMISEPGAEAWRPYRDADGVRLRIALGAIGFKPVGKEMMRDAVVTVADERQFDTAQLWLEDVVPAWDGVERIERSLSTYFLADDTPYTRAAGLYAWTAMAGRVLDPGCQADMALVMVSPQGYRKSSGVAAIPPSRDFFGVVNLEVRDDDLSRKMRGKLVIELAELRGLKSRDSESIKAWVTQREEEWTPKYMEYGVKFPRRCILWGTTNDTAFLGDPTGERRWLPMKVAGQARIDWIERDRNQLWAEARERWRAEGVLWSEAEALAKAEHGKFKDHDEWEPVVGHWLATGTDVGGALPLAKGFVRGGEVLVSALGFEARNIKKADEMRIAKVLTALGFERGDFWYEGKNNKGWGKK